MKVELIYDLDCPNVIAARDNLSMALASAGLAPKWVEWNRSEIDCPAYARNFGSPTILVDEHDVVPEDTAGSSCRLYASANGQIGRVPPVQTIAKALQAKPILRPSPNGRWKIMAALPSVGIALLPKLTCAACWPAYAAIMGSLGVGFFDYTAYLLPITSVALAGTLLSIGWRATSRRGYAPLALASAAAVGHLAGKFALESDALAHIGIAVLIGAALWNAWPVNAKAVSCRSCASS